MSESKLGGVAVRWAAVTACALAVGCGAETREGPPTAKVSGIVKVDGTPLENVEVQFINNATEYAVTAKTDGQGKYELRAAIGENKIAFSKYEGDPDPAEIEALGAGAKQLVPGDYSDPEKTPAKLTVGDDGSSSADFDLSAS